MKVVERSERGVTLTEVMIVGVIASLVLLGLAGFYMSSQATWLDASTKALTQREATLLIESLTASARSATDVTIDASDPQRCSVAFTLPSGDQHSYAWQDTLVYETDSLGTRPAVMASKVDRFELDTNDTLVFLRNLTLRSSSGEQTTFRSTMRMYNR